VRLRRRSGCSYSASLRIRSDTIAGTLISSGCAFEAEIGYSRAVVDGEWILVSGTTGFY
jgi:hypothetical protein